MYSFEIQRVQAIICRHWCAKECLPPSWQPVYQVAIPCLLSLPLQDLLALWHKPLHKLLAALHPPGSPPQQQTEDMWAQFSQYMPGS